MVGSYCVRDFVTLQFVATDVCQQLEDIGHRRTSPLWWGPLFISPSRSKSKQQQQEQPRGPRADCLYCGPFHSRYVVNCCPVGTIGGAGWSICVLLWPLLGVVSFYGFSKVQSARFRRRGSGSIACSSSTIQCNAETKYKHARPVLFVRSGMACGWKILQRWMHDGILWGVLSFRLLLSLDTHVLVLAFCSDSMQRRHHRLSALWVIAGLSQPFCQPFTPNSKTVPSEQIYTRKY